MQEFKLTTHKKLSLLCLGAHCDDIEIGVGGTLLKLISEKQVGSIDWVVFASNEVRKVEAENSAQKFLEGVPKQTVKINSWRDGFLPTCAGVIKDYFEELKRTLLPDVIFTHYRDDRHQDHRLVNDLTWNTWRSHLIFEYEIPKYDGDLGVPNFFVPLTEQQLARRNSILLNSFVSQQTKHWFTDETFRALPRLRGMESASVFAEAFYARKIVFT